MKQKLIIFVLFATAFVPALFASAGTILSTNKFAWSSNSGYINFENVIVSDTTLSGYAWSENSGWIKFNPAQGGVFNDGAGNLSGSAWGEGLGWIDFDSVSISTSTGRFSGTATGDGVGTINFDCPNYCDVKTDWLAVPVAPSTPLVIQNNAGSRSATRQVVDFVRNVIIVNNPLTIIPDQSGILSTILKAGNATVEVSSNTINGKTTFIISEEALGSDNSFLINNKSELVNGSFYDVIARDEKGNLIHEFSKPIKITLPIAKSQINLSNLKLYWLNETNWSWVLIPDAVFTKDKVIFYVNHLTRFAIFADQKIGSENIKTESNIALPKEKKAEYESNIENNIQESKTQDRAKGSFALIRNYSGIIILIGLILLVVFLNRRKNRNN